MADLQPMSEFCHLILFGVLYKCKHVLISLRSRWISLVDPMRQSGSLLAKRSRWRRAREPQAMQATVRPTSTPGFSLTDQSMPMHHLWWQKEERYWSCCDYIESSPNWLNFNLILTVIFKVSDGWRQEGSTEARKLSAESSGGQLDPRQLRKWDNNLFDYHDISSLVC